MKVELARLVEGRDLDFFEEWRAQDLELDAPGLAYEGPARVTVCVSRDAGIVRARVRFEARLRLTCARCFRDFSGPRETSFELSYPIDLSDDVLYLDDDIRQEIILGYDSKVLCRADCKGLCSRCGADLNEEECKCH